MTLAPLLGDTEAFVSAHGPAAVGAVIFLESFGAPVPGESLLVLSGVLAARGGISIVALLLWAWCGAVLGDSVGYLLGRSLGRTLIVRYGSRVGLTQARFAKVEAVFAEYGPGTVAFARFFDILRQLNGLVAGAAGMPFPRFLLFNAIGGALWVLTWGLGAWYFSDHAKSVESLLRHLGPIGIAALVAAAIAAIGLVVLLARILPVRMLPLASPDDRD
jgi:membrane protein DedA with SNARE-associated domain